MKEEQDRMMKSHNDPAQALNAGLKFSGMKNLEWTMMVNIARVDGLGG